MNLDRLDVGSMDQSAFQHLAQLPTLDSLAIQDEPEFIPLGPTPNSPAFQRLRELALRRVSSSFCVPAHCQETAHICSLLAAKCDPATLTHLIIDGVLRAPALRSTTCARSNHVRHAAASLLFPACPSLPARDDSAMRCDALRSLAVRASSSWVAALSRTCAAAFDASVMPEDGHATLPAAEMGLSLRWFEAVLVDPLPVAEYMSAVFLNLFKILTPDAYDVSEEMEDRVQELQLMWRDVLRMLTSKTAPLVKA
ncbi:hypothetical protein B0H13DRAFT_2412658 [Mycena leptocephala]|nr:hypothetical protein B0H13DRAFT_2412658 [Mycena leptocephala]